MAARLVAGSGSLQPHWSIRGGLVFKEHRLFYHSTLGLRVIKKKKTHLSIRRGTVRTGGTAAERGGNDLKGCEDFRIENGSRRGLNLALTVLFVPSSLDSGVSGVGGILYRNVQWFRGGLVFEAHRLLYHSASGSRTFYNL